MLKWHNYKVLIYSGGKFTSRRCMWMWWV